MKKAILFSLPFWLANIALALIIYNQNNQIKDLFVLKNIIDEQDDLKKKQFSAEDLNLARQSGKTDGKIETILQIDKIASEMNSDDIEKILKVAEGLQQKQDDVEISFIGLLARASYHKGLAVGIEESMHENNKAYEDGYHAAIDDITCPETGQLIPPKKENLKIKK